MVLATALWDSILGKGSKIKYVLKRIVHFLIGKALKGNTNY